MFLISKYKEQYKTNDVISFVNLKVKNAGLELCDPNHTFKGVRDFYSIHHIVNGCGKYIVGDNTYLLEAGDSFVVYPNKEVEYKADENSPWEYYWVGISGAYAPTLLNYTDFTPEYPIIKGDGKSDLKEYILDIYKAKGNSLSNEIEMIGRSYIFLSKLLSENKNTELSDDYSLKAKEIMDSNYDKNITTDDVAKRLNISRSHLHRVFTKTYGMPPGKYINNLRIEKACYMLSNTAHSINSISELLGFENQLYFSNVFKKHTGKSPRNYRKNSKGNI